MHPFRSSGRETCGGGFLSFLADIRTLQLVSAFEQFRADLYGLRCVMTWPSSVVPAFKRSRAHWQHIQLFLVPGKRLSQVVGLFIQSVGFRQYPTILDTLSHRLNIRPFKYQLPESIVEAFCLTSVHWALCPLIKNTIWFRLVQVASEPQKTVDILVPRQIVRPLTE